MTSPKIDLEHISFRVGLMTMKPTVLSNITLDSGIMNKKSWRENTP